ncbi:MAG TPA: serine hydrolase domain-containing protein [Streptosporangiaceae bacterium]|nr:serine hydrolase domain-containing protein [Streptosporangiaceae bacterium]
MTDIDVHGTVAPGFEDVRSEFAAVAAAEPGYSGQLAAFLGDRQVVDLWAGEDIAGDGLTSVYSVSKGAAHLVVALLVQDGVLHLDRPVADWWPEFAAFGKERLSLRELLAHRSGLIGVDGGFTVAELADDRLIASRLAGQHPFWRPGEAYGYHAFVISALTGEVVRRATGRSLRELFEERIRSPYGLDFYLGLPAAEDRRFQEVLPMRLTAEQEAGLAAQPRDPASLMSVAFNFNASPPTDIVEFGNTPQVRATGNASAGGVANARGVARMYAAAISAVDGREPLLTPETISEFSRLHYAGPDLVTGEADHFALGFETSWKKYPFLGGTAFGHSGATGSQSFADPASGIAYGYIRRRFILGGGGGSPENQRLAAAVVGAARLAPAGRL